MEARKVENRVVNLHWKVAVRLAVLRRSRSWLAEKLGTKWPSLRATIQSDYPSSRSLEKIADALGLQVMLFYVSDPQLPPELLEVPEGFDVGRDGEEDPE